MPVRARKFLIQFGDQFFFEDYSRARIVQLLALEHAKNKGTCFAHRGKNDIFSIVDVDNCEACRIADSECRCFEVPWIDLTRVRRAFAQRMGLIGRGVMARRIQGPLVQALRRERRNRIPRAIKNRALQMLSSFAYTDPATGLTKAVSADDAPQGLAEALYEAERNKAAKLFKFDEMAAAEKREQKSPRPHEPELPLIIVPEQPAAPKWEPNPANFETEWKPLKKGEE